MTIESGLEDMEGQLATTAYITSMGRRRRRAAPSTAASAISSGRCCGDAGGSAESPLASPVVALTGARGRAASARQL